jgi:hypothetical protein
MQGRKVRSSAEDASVFWFTTFHLNLMYSCIEEEMRTEVIRRCYRPLLELAGDCGVPLGIEASGLTLEIAQSIDPSWVERLRALIERGNVEWVGSGYAQIIGPLVPAEVNAVNLRLGHEVYERLLGVRPEIALVNEQAFSDGMVRHYLEAGYRALIMEWQNPAAAHSEWTPDRRYLPQLAGGPDGESIPVIWNDSIAFQKFQRCVHGEIDLDEYMDYLQGQVGDGPRAFSLYGNDVEVFDFRPGRYTTEAPLGDHSEWSVVRQVLAKIRADHRFRAVRPGEVLELACLPGAGNRLHLGSSSQPIPVKKQEKYNVTRWSVTGRDNLGANTSCWRIFRALREKARVEESEWRELCYLWSSDFRTHITEKRWRAYRDRLAAFEIKAGAATDNRRAEGPVTSQAQHFDTKARTHQERRFLTVELGNIRLRLNQRRGLAIDGLWFRDVSDLPLAGTLQHGFYDDISLGADFYTGHLTFEIPGHPKITDLNPVEPRLHRGEGWLEISGAVPTPLGPVRKRFRIFGEGLGLELEWNLDWETHPPGSLRLGHVTLNPAAFDRESLYFRTHNGGYRPETFSLNGVRVDHGAAVSCLVSARSGLGMTCGWLELGSAGKRLRVEADRTAAALLGMIQYRDAGKSYFCRLSFSAQELDETRNPGKPALEHTAFPPMRMVLSAQGRFREDDREGKRIDKETAPAIP